MPRQDDEGAKGALWSAARGSPFGDLAWGLLPLVLWGYLALCLLRAVTLHAPMAIAPDAGQLSAPAPQQATVVTNR